MPRRVLVLLAHPVLDRSRVNRRLIDAISDLEGVTLRDLYELYPSLAIDVRREQAALVEHQAVVFQHPFYWYSTPAILKEWLDLVLEHGWAYGREGRALRGKLAFNVTTTGGSAQAYHPEGANRFTVRQLLAPYDQTAHLCGMRYLPPFVVHSSLRLASDDDLAPHGRAYRRLLELVRDDALDLELACSCDSLNEALDRLGPP